MSRRHLRALVEDAHGQRRPRSEGHPEAVIPDFTKPDPLLTFKLDDIAFVYGSKWKQRYFTKVGDDYFPLGGAVGRDAQDVAALHGRDRIPTGGCRYYPADNEQRPTGPLCDGCHSVNYNIQTKTVTEWNVGCERAMVRAASTSRSPSAATIVNPAKLDFVRANDTCIQCHSQGQPLDESDQGKYYDWPVGFHQGGNLKDFWKLEEHKLGETDVHPLRRRHRAQEPDAGQRFRPER